MTGAVAVLTLAAASNGALGIAMETTSAGPATQATLGVANFVAALLFLGTILVGVFVAACTSRNRVILMKIDAQKAVMKKLSRW